VQQQGGEENKKETHRELEKPRQVRKFAYQGREKERGMLNVFSSKKLTGKPKEPGKSKRQKKGENRITSCVTHSTERGKVEGERRTSLRSYKLAADCLLTRGKKPEPD